MEFLLLKTILIEWFILSLVFYKYWPKAGLFILIAQCITHPIGSRLILYFHFPVWIVEILVIFTEMCIYRLVPMSWRMAILGSIIANVITWIL